MSLESGIEISDSETPLKILKDLGEPGSTKAIQTPRH